MAGWWQSKLLVICQFPKSYQRSTCANIFRLRDNNFLSQCLETTQNPNEEFNQIIWKNCPKDMFISRNVLKICVASAVMKGTLDKDINRIIKVDKKTLEISGKWKEL